MGRQEIGFTRGQALVQRTRLLREGLLHHWRLTDALGAHIPCMADAIQAAHMVGIEVTQDAEESHRDSNRARHSPPPGSVQLKRIPSGGILAPSLEHFRNELYVGAGAYGT